MKGIPAHQLVSTCYRIPIHVPCGKCGAHLLGAPTVYFQYLGLPWTWPETWCLKCGLPQFVNIGKRDGAPQSTFVESFKRLRALINTDAIPSDRVIVSNTLHVHSLCTGCRYDLFGVPASYRRYEGIALDPVAVVCPECGRHQPVHMWGTANFASRQPPSHARQEQHNPD